MIPCNSRLSFAFIPVFFSFFLSFLNLEIKVSNFLWYNIRPLLSERDSYYYHFLLNFSMYLRGPTLNSWLESLGWINWILGILLYIRSKLLIRMNILVVHQRGVWEPNSELFWFAERRRRRRRWRGTCLKHWVVSIQRARARNAPDWTVMRLHHELTLSKVACCGLVEGKVRVRSKLVDVSRSWVVNELESYVR
jgi:hypothetical protein